MKPSIRSSRSAAARTGRPTIFARMVVAAALLGTAVLATPAAAQVGDVSFPNSGDREAQTPFLHGLAQLHNFQYGEAAEAFREAQRLDPDFAMAYWGEAMTYNHPIWLEQDSTAAREVLSRLGATKEQRLARAGTDRERAFLSALEILYGPGPKERRDVAYAEAMRGVYEAYPDDPEAATFYALSVLGTAHSGRDFGIYMRAASIVEDVFRENPGHPGAAHYLIHSYDDPVHAPLGLRAAQAYSEIAPDAAHAQHMTSHIFVAMGMWPEVVAANENARRVARDGAVARGVEPRGCGHYNFWLEYGYLQLGRGGDAKRLLRECFETAQGAAGPRPGGDILDPDNTSQGSYAGMLARYILDMEAWDDESLRWTIPFGDLFPARLTWTFVNGYAAAKRGELVTTEVSREAIADARAELDGYISGEPSLGDASLAPAHQTRARILEMQLEALTLAGRGRTAEAIDVLERAAALEDQLPMFFGPPFVDKPSRELLGELLLDAGRIDEARAAFRAALDRTPNRRASLDGLERAGARVERAAGAGSAEADVLAAVQALFDAMEAGDQAAAADILMPEANLVSSRPTPDGTVARQETGAAFLEQLGQGSVGLERFWEPEVSIQGDVAVVWTRYDFHRDGAFSHCGTDAFTLIRIDGRWRVSSIAWTVERTNCEPSPLGEPGGR